MKSENIPFQKNVLKILLQTTVLGLASVHKVKLEWK